MNAIEIPPRLEELLRKDRVIHAAVLSSLAEFEPWFRMSRMPFFPEHTDHGPQHLTDVMATASSLARDEAWPVMTPEDAGALIISILLHDSGMHLTEEGFLSLISPGKSLGLFPADNPWHALWLSFLSEASRFDARKVNEIFGDTEPVHAPGNTPENWTRRDRLLIGEFLRRHHARIGHEIAVVGVPGPFGDRLTLQGCFSDLAQTAGLIARSHGLPIRKSFEHLSVEDRRLYRGIHVVFLMALIRVADYLQIHAERAPREFLRVSALRSPTSQGEWSSHDAVKEIRHIHDDPEAILVDALPADVKTYLKLKRLLTGLQEELDASWAALGETYGRIGPLTDLGISIRRVRSTLDDEAVFAKSSGVNYVPCHAAFDSAGADLLKLLITPLYGDQPEIGVRELIQNAVDARLELEDYLAQNPNVSQPTFTEQESDVLITLDEGADGERRVVVSDRGVGMTLDVLLNFFLKAGASFRRSDAWRREHELEPGRARVPRSGRFGVGVLASFLIGDQICVSTRHVGADHQGGFCFTAGIDTTEIEITRDSRPVGTTISIRVSSPEVWNRLNGHYTDWFCLSKPSVSRVVKSSPNDIVLKQGHSLPLAGAELPAGWHRISHLEYKDIQWTYQSAPFLVCNGIVIMKYRPPDYEKNRLADFWRDYSIAFRYPNVSVFDYDGHLPLVLQRTGLATPRYPFHEELFTEVCRDFVAFSLVHAPTAPLLSSALGYSHWYPGLQSATWGSGPKWLPWGCAPDGSFLVDLTHLHQLSPRRVLMIPSLEKSALKCNLSPREGQILVPFNLGGRKRRSWFRFAAGLSNDVAFGPLSEVSPGGSRILLSTKSYREVRQPRVVAQSSWATIKVEWSGDDYTLLQVGSCPGEATDLPSLVGKLPPESLDGLTEWFLDEHSVVVEEVSPIATAWHEIVGSPLVPFNNEIREINLHLAFEQLQPLIAAHEKPPKH